MGLTRAAVIFSYPPRYVFIPMFIIFAAACLLLAGCSNDDIVSPVDCGDDCLDEPVCSDSLPSLNILSPSAQTYAFYPPTFSFTIIIENYTAVAGMRHLLVEVLPGVPGEASIAMLNEHPEDFEDLWSEWEIPKNGYLRIDIGKDEALLNYGHYLFAVQVMDSCGRVDSLFTHERNAREFMVMIRYPVLTVMGKMLGSYEFNRTDSRPAPVRVPPGVPLAFMWSAPRNFDWMPMEYRHGWDVSNLEDDDAWAEGWHPWICKSSERAFYSGVHVMYIEARCSAGTITRARIEIEIMPMKMDRDLLWVDDWVLGDYNPSMYSPSEEVHDEFWTAICSRAPGFDPGRDILPIDEMYVAVGEDPLPLEVLSHYKHVIWTYGNSPANAWKNTIRFETESNGFRPNTLALYLAGGGSALTCGRTDRPGGGLVEIFPQSPLLPASVLDELDGGRYSMAHDDYYVTVIDKVSAQFKSGDAMPAVNRSLARDALYMAIEAGGGADLDFPDTLMLDETVTCSNCFFNPHDRGFTYVEVYDPAYYMDFIGARSHPCFTPIYTMWARSSRSPIHGAAIALKGAISGHFSTCEPGRYAYYDSYHFGFPLWFMEHEKVEQIADEIFRAWEIR